MRYLLIIIFTSFSLTAQTSGCITYKSEIISQTIDTTKIKNDDIKKMMLQTVENMKRQMPHISYELKFNKNSSVFKRKEMMAIDNSIDYIDIAGFSDADGRFFTLINNKLRLRTFKFRNKKYIIKSNLPKWEIDNKTKNILGYNCIKAKTNKQLDNGSSISVVAWFTKELPFSFGPKDYVGLPGLVLQVEERGIKFYATSIDFYNKNHKIELPNVNKSITRKEYLSQSLHR
ncbi:GLPGLI family protein [Psychroflexus sp. ALD_RP9]|uniref:GLPGLI family protein n=1 Tax=Psychroflexus sp. ALD_RP9 TaxID=2777186 RepID=UPI001A8CF3DE|nr:GLPGLI family protein [Psychroflexus sp. ALD_RP9]QSS97539.1 GLPGLI family protein [Psychroflexus sp. ALD_RP9]